MAVFAVKSITEEYKYKRIVSKVQKGGKSTCG